MSPAKETARLATLSDAGDAGRLLHDFNREYEEPTPGPERLARRIATLIAGGDTDVLLIGGAPDGIAVLRFREAIWSETPECYLAELYIVPAMRGKGLGRALMSGALEHARGRGALFMELATSEDDRAARSLYESLGFRNREGRGDGPVTFYYELGLQPPAQAAT